VNKFINVINFIFEIFVTNKSAAASTVQKKERTDSEWAAGS
jgi:hypothetical protein